MKFIIDISEETYNAVIDDEWIDSEYINNIINSIQNGTPLSEELENQKLLEDTVSRQAVDELSKNLVHTTRDKADFLCNFWEGLQKLPPVTPQPKKGRWISVEEELEKIKAEIIEKYWDCDICKYNGHFNIRGNINDILQIIDKHIAELKGENNA